MANLKSLAKTMIDSFASKTDSKVKVANDALVKEVKETVINDVIKTNLNVDISDLATKTELATKASVDDITTLQQNLALKANLSALDDYVTATQLANKKYMTESAVAAKAMYTAIDIVDAGLSGSFSSIWKNYDPDDMSKGNLYIKKTNSTDQSFSLIESDKDKIVLKYDNKTTPNECTITLGPSGELVLENKNLLGTSRLVITHAGIYWPISGADTYTSDDLLVRKSDIKGFEERISALEDAVRVQETEEDTADLGD